MELVFYPVNDFSPLMKGLVIGGVGILHVFLAQFAIGGGMLLCYMEWLAQTGREPNARRFVDGYFRVLVLVSFVLGALTGVGIWLVSIQVSPATIGMLVDEFHWIWSIEWTFFSLEITAGYLFYRYGKSLDNRLRLRLLMVYSFAAWMSLFWINGILSWQLTPGGWLEDRNTWAGFFNPGFWPSLLYRTVVCMTIAALVSCVVINVMHGLSREERRRLINRAAHFLAPMVLMPFLGLWYVATMPDDSREYILGGSMVMTMFLNLAIAASVLIGGYALIGMLFEKLYVNGATATLLCALAFLATAGGEFVREGVRKPYTVRQVLYANSLRPEHIAQLRQTGSVKDDPYPLRRRERYVNDQLALGAKVYRLQCSVCHTIRGTNALVDLAGSWTIDQVRMNVAMLQHTKPFMPPFAGDPEELEALVQYLRWEIAGAPDSWQESQDPEVQARLAGWLKQAGTLPGDATRRKRRQETSQTSGR